MEEENLLIKDEWFVVNEKQESIHVVTGGIQDERKVTFFLLHGADRKTQNTTHFQRHFSWLNNLGKWYAVDMLGYGISIPGSKANIPYTFPANQQIFALKKFIREKCPKPEDQIVLIGRSFGGKIALELADQLSPQIAAIILIAPPVSSDSLSRLAYKDILVTKKVLAFWAENDPIVPFSKSQVLVEFWNDNLKLVNVGNITTPPNETWRAHCPENERAELFHSEVEEFLKPSNKPQTSML